MLILCRDTNHRHAPLLELGEMMVVMTSQNHIELSVFVDELFYLVQRYVIFVIKTINLIEICRCWVVICDNCGKWPVKGQWEMSTDCLRVNKILYLCYMTLHELISEIKSVLVPMYGERESQWMVRDIFEEVKGYSAVDLVVRRDEVMSDFIVSRVRDMLARMAKNEPIQHILGYAHFCGNRFEVNEATLIPRPETQELVDRIADENEKSDLRVLDVGTGSGCIAITLARALRFAQVDAIDISDDALAVARRNAERLKAKVNFMHRDALSLVDDGTRYDIIVSNPPYIIEQEKADMAANVLDYEPWTALFVPDDDPLRFYVAIARYARETLNADGRLYLEINPLFARAMVDMLHDYGFANVEVVKDMMTRDRFVIATR